MNSALEKGEDYDKMKKSIVISIVNGTLFPETKKLHTIFRLREIDDDIQLSDRLELHFLELSKVPLDKPVEQLEPVEKLAAYFKYASDKTKEDYVQSLIQYGGEAIRMTERLFRDLTEDEIAYERRERKLKFEFDHNTELVLARKEGLEKGEMLKLIQLVCKKLAKNKSVQEIASDLEEDPACIQRVCTAAKGSAPDYDIEEIYERFNCVQQNR